MHKCRKINCVRFTKSTKSTVLCAQETQETQNENRDDARTSADARHAEWTQGQVQTWETHNKNRDDGFIRCKAVLKEKYQLSCTKQEKKKNKKRRKEGLALHQVSKLVGTLGVFHGKKLKVSALSKFPFYWLNAVDTLVIILWYKKR